MWEYNIQVNCISPGGVYTALIDYLISSGPDKAGSRAYAKALEIKKNSKASSTRLVKLISFLCSKYSNHLTGRLISSKWDSVEKLKKADKLSPNLYKLRRIDGKLFYEK